MRQLYLVKTSGVPFKDRDKTFANIRTQSYCILTCTSKQRWTPFVKVCFKTEAVTLISMYAMDDMSKKQEADTSTSVTVGLVV